MYRRVAAAAALAVAGLTAGAPLASAATDPTPDAGHGTSSTSQRAPGDIPAGSGNVDLLNGLNVLPVQACGLGIPILSGVLAAPDASCSVDNDAAQHN